VMQVPRELVPAVRELTARADRTRRSTPNTDQIRTLAWPG
jgi:hypothetical protein